MDMQGPGLELGRFFSDVQNLLGFGEQKQATPPPVEVEVEPVTMGVGLICKTLPHAIMPLTTVFCFCIHAILHS